MNDAAPASHRRRSSPRRRFWGVPTILLAIIALASPLAIGGVHATTAAAVALVACAGLIWHRAGAAKAADDGDASQDPTARAVLSIPALACALMALATLIQLLPLPTALWRLLQPTAYEALQATWAVAEPPTAAEGWHFLSVDPRQSAEQGLRWLALTATAILAAQITLGRRDRRRWLGLLLIAGALVTAAGIAQHLSGTARILGFYEGALPARGLAPFVSTNHSATFYGLMALLGCAYSLEYLRRSPLRATLGAVATTGALLLCAAHGSDGALAATVIALSALVAAAISGLSAQALTGRDKLRLAVVGAIFALALAAWFWPDSWTVSADPDRLNETSAAVRLDMAQSALRGAQDFPLVGSGAGATERALPPYVDYVYQGPNTIQTIENDPLEWIFNYGPLLALVVIALFIWALARTLPHIWQRRGRRGAAQAAAVMLFMAVVAQFHFPSWVLGISAVAIIAIEICLDRRRDPLFVETSPPVMALMVAALALATAGLWTAHATVLAPGPEDSLEVSTTIDDATVQALRRYPTDGVLVSAMALAHGEAGDHDHALALAERAFELRPHPQQQFLLALSHSRLRDYDAAAALYADLFDRQRRRGSYFGWARNRLRYNLPTAVTRAAAMADARPDQIEWLGREIARHEGPLAAVDYALALVDERPERPAAHLHLVRRYEAADELELAEMYARMLIARNLVGPDGERPAGLRFLLTFLERHDRQAAARRIARRAFATGNATPELARLVLTLRPDAPTDLADDDRPLFEEALSRGCTPPYEADHRRLCWESHAYFAEANGDVDAAIADLRRVAYQFDAPRLLGELLVRHGRCRELASLRREYEGQRVEGALRNLESDCARQ